MLMRIAFRRAALRATVCSMLAVWLPAWASSAIERRADVEKSSPEGRHEAAGKAAPKTSTAKTEPRVQGTSTPRKTSTDKAETLVEEPPDPLVRLRERLAQRLGAQNVASGNPSELKLVSRLPPSAPSETARSSYAGAAAGAGSTHAEKAKGTAMASAPAAHAAQDGGHWSYAGTAGPEVWGRLKPEFIACARGERQSPIDIRDGFRLQLDAVQFDYRPGAFRVIDNGHTVQANLAPGSFITVMGRRYELKQFHFHRPSEERVAGRAFDMSVHLVHKDAEGRIAVVAVLLERDGLNPAAVQPVVQAVWNNLPLEKNEELAAQAPLDPNALLPLDRSYYTYMGSLTTPPCSEGVLWMVLKQPVTLAQSQLDVFARLYPMNARPVQRTAGRMIKESE